jgi:hypothetical protein
MDRPDTSPYQKHSRYPGASPTSHLDRPDSSSSSAPPGPTRHQYYSGPSPRPSLLTDAGHARTHSGSFGSPNDYSKWTVYHPSAASPRSITSSSIHDQGMALGDHYDDGLTSPVAIPALGMSVPKRAYRQRRKDPSCDACRERKVKVKLA